MKPLGSLFHRRSLTLSVFALLLSLGALAYCFAFGIRPLPPTTGSTVQGICLLVVASLVCIHGAVNLVRDVDRGYAPSRCSLAAVLFLLAFALVSWMGVTLIQFIIHETRNG